MTEQRIAIVGTELKDQYAAIAPFNPYKRYTFWEEVSKLLRVNSDNSDEAIQHASALSNPRNISVAMRAAFLDRSMVRSSALMVIAAMVRHNPELRVNLKTIAKWEKRKILREYRDKKQASNERPHIDAVIQAILEGTQKPSKTRGVASSLPLSGRANTPSNEDPHPVVSGSGRAPNLTVFIPQ